MEQLFQLYPHLWEAYKAEGSDSLVKFFKKKYIYSNFHPCPNLTVHGASYSSVEQYYQAAKSWSCGDMEAYEKIMESDSTVQMKKLGGKVVGSWPAELKVPMMLFGQESKYLQDAYFREELLATDGQILVEASPSDKFWGIGLPIHSPASNHISLWKGANWMGILLTWVRERIKEDLPITPCPFTFQ